MAMAFLSLGCNIGDCRANLSRALALLAAGPDIAVTRVSSVYITEPVGKKEQPDFFNIAAELKTGLEPLALLARCQSIELELGGREGRVAQGPRTIDLDLVLFGRVEMAHPDLTLPHPRMATRAFVLEPLAEIAPDQVMPGGKTVRQALAELDDPHAVRRDGPLNEPVEG